MAREKGLDLIEIAPNAKPPVCRIMDSGKYKYQKSKEDKKQKNKQRAIKELMKHIHNSEERIKKGYYH